MSIVVGMENGDVATAGHKEVGSENVVILNGVTPTAGPRVVDVVTEELSKDVDVIGDGTEAEVAADVVSLEDVPAEQQQAEHQESDAASVVVEVALHGESGHDNAADTHVARSHISDNADDMIGNVDATANAAIFDIVEDAKAESQQQASNQHWQQPQVVYQHEHEQQALQSQELQPPAEQPTAVVSAAPPVASLPSIAQSTQPQEDPSMHSQTHSQPTCQPQPQPQAQAQLQAQSQIPPAQQQQQQQAVVYPQRTGSSYSALLSAELQTSRPAPAPSPSSVPLPARNEAKAAAAAAAAAAGSTSTPAAASSPAAAAPTVPAGSSVTQQTTRLAGSAAPSLDPRPRPASAAPGSAAQQGAGSAAGATSQAKAEAVGQVAMHVVGVSTSGALGMTHAPAGVTSGTAASSDTAASAGPSSQLSMVQYSMGAAAGMGVQGGGAGGAVGGAAGAAVSQSLGAPLTSSSPGTVAAFHGGGAAGSVAGQMQQQQAAASPPVPWGQVSVNLRAFNLFAARIRPEVRAANPHLGGPEIERAIGQRWNALGPPAREEFLQAAREERAALIAAGLLDPNARPRRRRRKRAEIEADNMMRLQQQQMAAAARAAAAVAAGKGGDAAAAALRRLQQLQGGAGRGRGRSAFPYGSGTGGIGEDVGGTAEAGFAAGMEASGGGQFGGQHGQWTNDAGVYAGSSIKRDPEEVLRLVGGVAIGQRAEAVVEGAFDAGLFIAVHFPVVDGGEEGREDDGGGGKSTTVLRGVVFVPGLAVPVSHANDLAPGVHHEDVNVMEDGDMMAGNEGVQGEEGDALGRTGQGQEDGGRREMNQQQRHAAGMAGQEELEDDGGEDGDGMDVVGVDNGKDQHLNVVNHGHPGMTHAGHAMSHAGLSHPGMSHTAMAHAAAAAAAAAAHHGSHVDHVGHVGPRHDMTHMMAMGHAGHAAVSHAPEVGHAVVGHAPMGHATMGHASMAMAPHAAGLDMSMSMRASMMAMAPQPGAPTALTYHPELVHHHMASQASMQAMRAMPPGMLPPGMTYTAAGMPVLAGVPHGQVVQAHDMATAAAVAAAAAHAAAAAAGHAGPPDMGSTDVDIDVVAGGGPMDDMPSHG